MDNEVVGHSDQPPPHCFFTQFLVAASPPRHRASSRRLPSSSSLFDWRQVQTPSRATRSMCSLSGVVR
ncbi:hypothetical protein ACOSQ3_022059 [Xanthoceras sorbifolium]